MPNDKTNTKYLNKKKKLRLNMRKNNGEDTKNTQMRKGKITRLYFNIKSLSSGYMV